MKKYKYPLIIFILLVISSVIIIIKGNTYEVKTKFPINIDKEEININIEGDINLTKKEQKNNTLYLTFKGNKKGKAIVEIKPTNTYENIKFSHKLITNKTKDVNIAYSTTNYHVFRAGAIASSLNIKMEGIGANTKRYFWANAFIREFIASLFSERKKTS